MSVQSGNPGGYDPSLTISEQVTATQARITKLLANGREGSTAIQAARQQLANLQGLQTSHQAAVVATKATLAAHAAHNVGTTSAQFANKDVTE